MTTNIYDAPSASFAASAESSVLTDQKPLARIECHYTVQLPDGECVTISDLVSAERLTNFLNKEFSTPQVIHVKRTI